MDPSNYSTAVAAGSAHRFKLLFSVLVSNFMAAFWQWQLLPDLAEVVETAISLNILFHIPLALGVILTVVDVLIVLLAYKPNGSMKGIRIFEAFVYFIGGSYRSLLYC
ncbi:CFS_G0024000.mRNA.1.CDS.1 [Saccharomyces cerevisiae]|nr:CFS_G0024000.mRNA.1.CDS.1 [Saccharomyces cerevisiae]CAI7331570.1 CFS_G0024000.mRNA.1.CDS.1 [Saccharomyces cerevisiae]